MAIIGYQTAGNKTLALGLSKVLKDYVKKCQEEMKKGEHKRKDKGGKVRRGGRNVSWSAAAIRDAEYMWWATL